MSGVRIPLSLPTLGKLTHFIIYEVCDYYILTHNICYYGFFHCFEGSDKDFMKITIQNLEFPSEFKKKLKIKVNNNKLIIEFISGHVINLDKTNLSVIEPHRIIVTNENKTLIALSMKMLIKFIYLIMVFLYRILNSMIKK